MSSIAFVLGNGESRKGIDINDLKEKGIIECEVGVATTIGQTSTVTWNLNND